MDKWYKKIIGARTIKTGLATFLTSLFCLMLDLTPIFAILTAIVTIEPTAKASLKKGYRRLPATVIGALFAVLFTFIFGDQSALTYTFSALFTILVCTKLNLQVGTTVAVLTSVAMIPGIHDAYLFNFFSRLLTALIGLVTAGLVNFIVLPPKYYQQIEDNLTQSEYKMYELFSSRCNELLLGKFDSDHSNDLLNKLMGVINKTETLTSYQKDELRYHKNKEDEWKRLKNISNRSYIDRLLATHLSNIIYLPKHIHLVFTPEEKIAIIKISNSVNNIIKSNHFEPHRSSASTLKSSVKRLEEFDQNQIKSHVIYEILLIYKLLDSRYNDK
ncbi:aromatic acid exporter family protein [Staphylococcus haemolyticus]|uniref:FUSC family protein n=1 Tax=Staphylococcus haemolyticus TaxID=1283 RepID=UPI001F0AAEBB|nr:aromatic acid exporter family protein [Staphylococcus haemolyticus]MCH4460739.1 aromatic acid exporter family protein [Staphylococcus haemolyticus]MCH4484289.1 aromatic acid exporter family protein [Staphylococcus haemolyticus]MEB5762251.1 aromatic acid exporter family protein [Staphylococcus haemolyticus]